MRSGLSIPSRRSGTLTAARPAGSSGGAQGLPGGGKVPEQRGGRVLSWKALRERQHEPVLGQITFNVRSDSCLGIFHDKLQCPNPGNKTNNMKLFVNRVTPFVVDRFHTLLSGRSQVWCLGCPGLCRDLKILQWWSPLAEILMCKECVNAGVCFYGGWHYAMMSFYYMSLFVLEITMLFQIVRVSL